MGKKIYVCYTEQDKDDFDLFLAQSKKEKINYELVYTENKEPELEEWKAETVSKIKSCNGIVVLISPNLKIAADGFWEMKCAKEASKPIIAVFVGAAGIIDKPRDLMGVFTMVMAWDRLADFVNKLN